MSFFEEIPKPEIEVEARHRQPVWAGPPENMVGTTVPVDRTLANTGDLAVVLGGMTAYPTGVLFDVEILRRTFEGEEDDPFSSGGGGGLSYAMDFWLWPLPGEGTLRLACEWPDQGLPETVHDLDTAPIRAAAARAVELWPDDRPVGDDEW
jgi:hypothetical protein